MNLSVGQVVFLLTKKSSKVYPVLVCEEIKKRSLAGETVNYVVRLPTDDSTEVEIDKLDAEIFETVDHAREAIIGRISEQVDQMLQSAISLSEMFSEFVISGDEKNETDNSSADSDVPVPEGDFALVDLGDGNVARLNIKDAGDIIGSQNE